MMGSGGELTLHTRRSWHLECQGSVLSSATHTHAHHQCEEKSGQSYMNEIQDFELSNNGRLNEKNEVGG